MMPPWRRLACHIAPIAVSIVVGYVAIELLANRYMPRSVLASEVIPPTVRAGETAYVQFEAVDDRQCSAVVYRWVTDSTGTIYDLPDARALYHDTPDGQTFKFSRPFTVPRIAAGGDALYHSRAVRWCNVFQEFVWPLTYNYKVPFKIIAADATK